MEKLNLTEPAKIKVAATFNSAADHYDDAPLAYWDVIGRRTVDRLDLRRGFTVLDVGCGTGASALPAAERVGPSGRILGVDLADKLLDLARAKAAKRRLHNVEFRQGDMTALGFPDGNFDAVVSVFSVFFVSDMEGLVRELWRMVKPGGKLAITTWGPRNLEPAHTAWRESVQAERPDLYSPSRRWDRIALPQQVRKLMEDGGVSNAEVVLESGSQVLRTPEDWWTIVMGTGLRGTVDAMDGKTAARIRDHNISWVRDHRVESVEINVIYAVATKELG